MCKRRTGNNPTKYSLAKILILGLKKAKKREVFKSNNSFECSPLFTDTFTDQNLPKKLRRAFFVFFTDVWQEVAILSLCLDRSYRESAVTVRCFFCGNPQEINIFYFTLGVAVIVFRVSQSQYLTNFLNKKTILRRRRVSQSVHSNHDFRRLIFLKISGIGHILFL